MRMQCRYIGILIGSSRMTYIHQCISLMQILPSCLWLQQYIIAKQFLEMPIKVTSACICEKLEICLGRHFGNLCTTYSHHLPHNYPISRYWLLSQCHRPCTRLCFQSCPLLEAPYQLSRNFIFTFYIFMSTLYAGLLDLNNSFSR